MRKVEYRYNRPKTKRHLPKWLKIVLIVLGVLVALFALSNLIMGLMYRNKVLPNYSVAAVGIGNVAFDQLDERVSVEKLLPKQVTLKKDDKTKEISPKDLGVAVDWDATQENIKKSRSWLPLISLFTKRTVPAELKLNNAQFASAAKDLEVVFIKPPLPERIVFNGQNFAIVEPEPGYQMEVVQLRLDLIGLLEKGQATLFVPTTTTNSTEPTGNLGGDLSQLQKRLQTKITLISGVQKKQLSPVDIGGFYASSGQTMQLSDAKINQVISDIAAGMGTSPVNQSEAIQASYYALSKQQPINFVLADRNAEVHRYCVAVKGVSASLIPEYRQKLAAVYADPRGWNKGGDVTFVYAKSGCDYTAWLSSAANVTSFSSSVCDNYYSCRVGPNVIVNYDRWKGATEPWNAAGGSLEDYRVMVINHETGHWLGFGHRNCPDAGKPAPVMQQQSMSLQGCTFNPWPTAAELAAL